MRNVGRKLELNRETVYRLDPQDLRHARGGAGIVSSDNRQCTYSKQCEPGGVVVIDPGNPQPAQPIGPAQPVG